MAKLLVSSERSNDKDTPPKPKRPLERSGLQPPTGPMSPPSPASPKGPTSSPMPGVTGPRIPREEVVESAAPSQPPLLTQSGNHGNGIGSDPGSGMGTSSPPFTPAQVGYTSGQDRCGGCGHFRQPSACEYVQGVIDPEGSCSLHSNLSGMGGGLGMENETPLHESLESPETEALEALSEPEEEEKEREYV